MADSKITQLTAITTVDTTDVLPIVDLTDVTTKKVTIAQIAAQAPVQSVASKTGAVTLVKGDVGLGNVDNTSDANKPISTATQTALNAKQDTLVSGTNIKTINSTSILGSGNIVISGGGTPSGVAGAIQFSDGSAFASDATNFFWDDTNKRLGIGTNSPTSRLHIKGVGATSSTISQLWQNSSGTTLAQVRDDGAIMCNAFRGINYANTWFSMGVNIEWFSRNFVSQSTTGTIVVSKVTTTQKTAFTSPSAGAIVWDTTLSKLQVYDGTLWIDLH